MQDDLKSSQQNFAYYSNCDYFILEKLQHFDAFSNSIAVSFIKPKPNKAWLWSSWLRAGFVSWKEKSQTRVEASDF